MRRTDKLCLAALVLLWFGAALWEIGLDMAAYRKIEADKPPLELTWEAPMEEPVLVEAVALQLEPDPYRADIPLDRACQAALRESCEEHNVPVSLALGLIEEESGFDPEAVSSKGAYGLFQLNPKYFPKDLSPAENIRAGVSWLGELLERHGDPAAALRAYNLGWDDGDRVFAEAVQTAAARWEAVL